MKSPFKQNTSSFLTNKDTANKNTPLKFNKFQFDNNLNLLNNNQSNIKKYYPRQNYLKNNLDIIYETNSNYSSNTKKNNENILEDFQKRYYQSKEKNYERPIYRNYDEKHNFIMKNDFLSKKFYLFKFRY